MMETRNPEELIQTLTASTFQARVLEAEGPIAVEFMSYGCGYCRALEPVLEKAAKELEATEQVFRVNVAVEPDLASEYQVNGTPTFIMFLGAQEVGRFEGTEAEPLEPPEGGHGAVRDMTTTNIFRIRRTPILLFDDECAVCRRIAHWVRRSAKSGDRPASLTVCPIGNDPAALRALSPGLDIWKAYETIHLLMPDGSMRVGGEAVAETLRRLPISERIAHCFSWRMFGFRPFQRMLDIAYLVLADIRPLLGCESCGSSSKWVELVRSFFGLFRGKSKKTAVAGSPHFTRTAAPGGVLAAR